MRNLRIKLFVDEVRLLSLTSHNTGRPLTMTIDEIKQLPTCALRAIVRSTNPAGRYWLEYMTARDELARRQGAR